MCTSRRLRFSGGITAGVTMNALTPFTVIASVLTPRRSRRAGRLRPAAGADNVLHSSTLVGAVFQFAGGAPAISVCICGLTVLGTGMVRAGTVRGSVEFVWVLASLDMNRTIIATMTKENPSTTRRSRRSEFVMVFVLEQQAAISEIDIRAGLCVSVAPGPCCSAAGYRLTTGL